MPGENSNNMNDCVDDDDDDDDDMVLWMLSWTHLCCMFSFFMFQILPTRSTEQGGQRLAKTTTQRTVSNRQANYIIGQALERL
jgi:hypothetical protein